MKKNDIKKEVEKTLDVLNDHERIEASPFFYTKLQERIKREEEDQRPMFSSLYILQYVIIVIFIFVNIFTTVKLINQNNENEINLLVEEYGVNNTKRVVQDYVFNEE